MAQNWVPPCAALRARAPAAPLLRKEIGLIDAARHVERVLPEPFGPISACISFERMLKLDPVARFETAEVLRQISGRKITLLVTS